MSVESEASSSPHSQCKVCDSPASKIHFGALVCKACAAFFRRTLAENKEYKCRFDNDCDILATLNRNACRKCRIKKCFLVGMTKNPQLSSAEMKMPEHTNVLDRISASYHAFCESQKSIFELKNEVVLDHNFHFKAMTRDEHNYMEQANARLIAELLAETFDVFNDLSESDKNTMFNAFAVRFSLLHRALMTYKHVPDKTDTRIVYHYGLFCGVDDLQHLHGSIENLDWRIKASAPMKVALKKFSNKIGPLDMTDFEIGGFMGLIFYSQLEHHNIWNEKLASEKSKIFEEMYREILKWTSIDTVGLRYGNIVSFLFDVEGLMTVFENAIITSELFAGYLKDFFIIGKN